VIAGGIEWVSSMHALEPGDVLAKKSNAALTLD
jgi:hypothetical protein